MKSLKEILKSLEGLSDIELFVIDLFCGAGGLSEGVEEARLNGKRCVKVVCCVNHDKTPSFHMMPTFLMHSTSSKTSAHWSFPQ